MSSKLTRTILIAGCIGFLIVWVLEFRRTTLFESYWLLLLSITCLLFFQFSRLKASLIARRKLEEEGQVKKATPIKPVRK
jgi:CDP-diglyceride synthetase